MKMPDTMLVAVIIGVTNIIPFFGPFIGAIPSFIIIVLQNPVQGLYFLIFVIILQQVDGNIIGPRSSEIPPGFPLSGLCLQFWYLAVCGAFLECCLACRSWQ